MSLKLANDAEHVSEQGRFRLLSGALAVAVAIWLLPASIHIVKWPAGGPVRLAYLAPVWLLAALVVSAFLVCGFLLWRSASAGPYARLVHALAGCSPLWLWAIPYLPWLADAFPLTLVLAGPVRYAILGWVLARSLSGVPLASRLREAMLHLGRRQIFTASLVLYLGAGLYSARQTALAGDEPAYLVIVESLLRDRDLKIENNHQQNDYRPFHPDPLPPDYMQRGKNGAIYSVHAPGLPALLAPSYALLGRSGTVVMLALMAALAALAIFDLALALTDRSTAVVTWVATALTVPFVPQAWLIFPELPGLLVAAWAALWTWQSIERPVWTWVWRGILLGALPWLHTKFVILTAVFGAGLALRLRRRPRDLVALLGPAALLCALWIYFFQVVYGTFNPEAPYGDYTRTYVLLKYIPHGLIGLLFDQKFGLLVYSPIYVVAVFGAWLMLRRPDLRWLALTLIVAMAAFTLSTARLYMFWGGASAPARFLVPLIPCLSPMVAVAIQTIRSTRARALVAVAVVWGVAVAGLGALRPGALYLFSDPHGRSRLLEVVEGGFPLSLLLPTFTDPDWLSQIPRLAILLTIVGAALVIALAAGRLQVSAWGTAAAFGAVLLIGGAVVSAAPDARVREEAARQGALEAIWRLDDPRLRAFDYEALGFSSDARLRRLASVDLPAADPVSQASGTGAGRIRVPAGRYEVVVWFTRPSPGNGEVIVGTTPQTEVARLVGAFGNPTRIPVTLPIGSTQLDVRVADAVVAGYVSRVEIVPVEIYPWDQPRAAARVTEGLPGRDGAYLGYLDEDAYPEGGVFWTRGTGEAHVLVVAPAGASKLKLVLYTGPMDGQVRLAVGGESRTITTVRGEAVTETFDIPPGRHLVPVSVRSSVMFVPKMTDAGSDDDRALGCQVRVLLE